MMKSGMNHKLWLLAVVIVLASGCASMQPVSNYARSGDTVMLVLGGTDEGNAQVPVLKKQNITVTITDSLGSTYAVKLRYLFRTYSDPTSKYSYRASTYVGRYYETYVPPYSGEWVAVIDLSDPVTGDPVPVSAGPATISVTSPDLASFVDFPNYGWTWTNGDLSSIPIEILAGTGSSNPMNYLDPVTYDPMTALEPLPQIEVVPGGTPTAAVGGGSFTFSYQNADFGDGIRVMPTTPDPGVQIGFKQIDQGDGTSLLNVIIMNPNGFRINNDRAVGLIRGKSLFRSLGFVLTWENGTVDDSNWEASIQMINGSYVDIQGNAMPELTPAISKVY